jgi:hypothetical protein
VWSSPAGANDWWEDRVLSPIYVTALDAVTQDAEVIERLGDSITATTGGEEGTELFRRVGVGDFEETGKTIEFDIKGAKDSAVVKVLAIGPADSGSAPGRYVEWRVGKIRVICSDGSEIEVPVPNNQPAVTPIR